jgi:hypothetical protein
MLLCGMNRHARWVVWWAICANDESLLMANYRQRMIALKVVRTDRGNRGGANQRGKAAQKLDGRQHDMGLAQNGANQRTLGAG